MKKYLILILLLLVGMSSFAVEYLGMSIPLPGESIANKIAQTSALGYVFSKVAQEQKKCRKLSIVDTKVTKKPENVQYNKHKRQIAGNWGEEWTVNACGANYVVPVDFEVTRSRVVPTVGKPKRTK